ncbi:MAG: AAA family ATPase, partial [Deltaproteobacteria bacterium]|nr:AAA family ATPase [Deltaproteobacteria bacterium]
MRCLVYADLAPGTLAKKVAKVVAALERDDFASAEVKKLHAGNYYRAKLDDASRLLLQFAEVGGQTVCLVLEVIAHHDYAKSRFLRGAEVDETKLVATAGVPAQDRQPLRYVHPTRPEFLLLDKPLSLDDAQDAARRQRPPLVLVGSAGSGKTAVLLSMLRTQAGRVAYVTESRWLAETARGLYVAFAGAPEGQEADFLSYQQLLETVHIPAGRPVTFQDFRGFFARHQHKLKFADAHAVFEELRGVLTAEPEGPYDRATYLELGVKQSLFDREARAAIYEVFERYREWLGQSGLYEPNLVAHAQLGQVQPTYDFVAVDEVQDLTNVQLALILRALAKPGGFVLAGDANQIVHPNYFAWSKVKSLFWRGVGDADSAAVHILGISYRNSPEVTAVANRLLKLKHLRFGSIDRETNRLMEAVGGQSGVVSALQTGTPSVRDLDERTRQSTLAAVVVLRDADKAEAKKVFRTPLVFSIHEAKGLEYQTVILYRLLSAEAKLYSDLAQGVTAADLQGDELAYRRAKDKADKSLELYKFYVNALYVGLTRAVRSAILVEDQPRHPLLGLLGIALARDASGIAAAKASTEQWQREAQRLEAQGKREQAEAIRRDVLRQTAVPWPVHDAEHLPALWQLAIDPKPSAQKTRQNMLEFAWLHADWPTHTHLALVSRSGALPEVRFFQQQPAKVKEVLAKALGKGLTALLADTERYGVDHRTQSGLTLLMLAAYTGDVPLCEALLQRGARLDLRDHRGRMAMHWALRGALDGSHSKRDAMGRIYDQVALPSVDIDVAGKLVQLGRESGEYLLLALIVARQDEQRGPYGQLVEYVTAAMLRSGAFENLPEVVVPAKRKTGTYLNNVLARACVGSNYTACRQLWVRKSQGNYMLNPAARLAVSDEHGERSWLHFDEAFGAAWARQHNRAVSNYMYGGQLPPWTWPT